MAQALVSVLSPISFAIQNLWQLKEAYTMNLILFEDDEIECELDNIPLPTKNDDNDIAVNQINQNAIANKLRVIYLKKDDYRCKHIEKVLKSKSSDTVRVGIVNGKQGLATVLWNKDQNDNANSNKFYLKLSIIESSMSMIIDKIAQHITLILAMPRPKVINRLYPILSSIGVKEIILVGAKRVEKSYFNSKYLEPNRYTKGLMAGMVQCRDTILPKVSIERNLKHFICNKLNQMYPTQNSIKIVAHPGNYPRIGELNCFKMNDNAQNDDNNIMNSNVDPDDNLDNDMSIDSQTHIHNIIDPDNTDMKQNNNDKHKHFILAIGPEGGWVDDEIEMLEKNNFNLCSIGMRILRSDVAVVSLLSILRNYIECYLDLRSM